MIHLLKKCIMVMGLLTPLAAYAEPPANQNA